MESDHPSDGRWGWREEAVGLGMVSGTAGRRNGFRSIQKHIQHQWEGVEEMQLGSSHVQEGKARSTAETWDAQAGDKEKPFPQEDNPAAEAGPGKGGLSLTLRVLHPPWPAWSDPPAEPALGWDWRPHQVSTSLSYLMILQIYHMH